MWTAAGILAGIVVAILINLLTRDKKDSSKASGALVPIVAGIVVFTVIWIYAATRPTTTSGDQTSGAPGGAPVATRGPASSASDPAAGQGSTPSAGPVKTGTYDIDKVSHYPGAAQYYVQVKSARVHDDLVTVNFESFGAFDLRPPQSSCIFDASGDSRTVSDTHLRSSSLTHYAGTLDFAVDGLAAPLTFVYSCADYAEITIIT